MSRITTQIETILNNLLSGIISSKTRIKLLVRFFFNPKTTSYLRELAKEKKVSLWQKKFPFGEIFVKNIAPDMYDAGPMLAGTFGTLDVGETGGGGNGGNGGGDGGNGGNGGDVGNDTGDDPCDTGDDHTGTAG